MLCIAVWQFMQPVRMLVWSHVSNAVLAKADVASELPGKLNYGVPGLAGVLPGTGHWVIVSW